MGLGDEGYWTATADRLKARVLQLKPSAFRRRIFEVRGDYREYFAN